MGAGDTFLRIQNLFNSRNMHAKSKGQTKINLPRSFQQERCVLIICILSKTTVYYFQHWFLLQVLILVLWWFVYTFRGHKKDNKFCQHHTNPHNFPELGPVNSVVCEQTFSYTNHYTNLKVMNEPWYNFFWLYILDLNKNLVEDPRVLSPVRMNKILEKILANSMMKVDVKKIRDTTW